MKDESHARNYILTKAAPMEVGFMSSSDLPESMSVRQAEAAEASQDVRAFEVKTNLLRWSRRTRRCI
jgi:hypothetical protein